LCPVKHHAAVLTVQHPRLRCSTVQHLWNSNTPKSKGFKQLRSPDRDKDEQADQITRTICCLRMHC
jgi:hypothetical protein